jgi:FHS family Na+ dependent glucose MFS transporter 1
LALLPVVLLLFSTSSPKAKPRIHSITEQGSLKILTLFALLAFIYVGSEVSFGGWIFSYYQAANPEVGSAGYMLNSLFYLAIMFGRLLAILLAIYIRPRHLIWLFLGGAVLSAALMSMASSQPWSIWLGTVGLGLSLAAIFPTTFSYVGRKTQLSGKQNGLVWASGSLGAMILPWIIGRTFEYPGPINMMSILLGMWIVALGLFLAMDRFSTRKETRQA